MSANIYQIVTDRICEQLEKGIIPWNRPWTGVADGAISYTTRKPYSLLNQMLLGEDGEYITFNEVAKLGGKVKKGAKSQMGVFFKRYIKEESGINPETGEEENKEKISFALRYYNVFNIKDCEGIPAKAIEEKDYLQRIKQARKLYLSILIEKPQTVLHLKILRETGHIIVLLWIRLYYH